MTTVNIHIVDLFMRIICYIKVVFLTINGKINN